MIAVYVLLAVNIAVSAVVCVAFAAMRKKANNGGGVGIDELRVENEKLRNEIESAVKNDVENAMKLSNTMLSGVLNAQNDNIIRLADRIDRLTATTDEKLENVRKDTYANLSGVKDAVNANLNDLKGSITHNINELKAVNAQSLCEVRDDNAKNLERMRKDNAEQLEKMRETVDEKLSSTLEKRFDASFKIVNDRLEEIGRTFAELQGLQTGISDLNKLFKNVKTRGTWGEVSLENLLNQILVPEQYAKQVRIKRSSDDAVDFAIKMPGQGDGEVLLPIDAKFPIEDYARLAEASEKADVEGIEKASKALASRVKAEAMSIRNKYVNPPKTTDFAIMYLPTEGLYAEIIRRDGLVEEIQNQCRVVVCGPTTIAALLNSLQMGFRSVAVAKNSAEIRKLLTAFIKDFEKFATLLRQTGDKLGGVQDTIANAEKRTEMIRKKLDKVSQIASDDEQTNQALPESIDADISGEVAVDSVE